MTFNQIREEVIKNGFGRHLIVDAETCLVFSQGIMIAMEHAENNSFEEDMSQALAKFLTGDYGDFYCWGEKPTPNREYGKYPCCLGESIRVHREPYYPDPSRNEILIYFQFER